MSFLFIFMHSVVLTIVVGLLLLLTGRPARERRAIAAYLGVAALIHLLWWRLPDLSGFASVCGRWLVSAWLATLVIAAVLVIPCALASLIVKAIRRGALGARYLPTAISVIAVTCGLAASFGTVGDPVIREEEIGSSRLPEALNGLRIANLGDVHIGRFITPSDLLRAVELVNNRNVDVLAITGDLIDDVSQLEATLDALEASTARPILGILGNHEKGESEQAIIAAYQRRSPSMDLLINQSVAVQTRGGVVRFVGVDYPMDAHGGHMLPRDQQDAAMRAYADQAFADLPPGDLVVALAHHPDFFDFASSRGALLTLASHTHGGQVSFFGRPVIQAYRYMHGAYRHGDANLDVSAGLGHWLPIRIGVPREIVIVTLRRTRGS